MSWIVASETIDRPEPRGMTPTRRCRETLYTLIPLGGKYGKGEFAKVSLEDYPYLKQFNWWVNNGGYTVRKQKLGNRWKVPLMHREIMVRMGLAEDVFGTFLADHRNRHRIDNRRQNLREATRQQNSFNLTKRPMERAYIGVYKEKDNRFFRAHISLGTQKGRFSVGGFKSAAEAARVRDALARFYQGEFAVTNFEGSEAYSIEIARRLSRKAINSSHVSKYSGVTYIHNRTSEIREKPWIARFIDKNHKRHYLGVHATQEEAARAVDDARVAAGLPRVNFPDEVT